VRQYTTTQAARMDPRRVVDTTPARAMARTAA